VTQPPQGPSYPGGRDDPWSRPTPPTERNPSAQPGQPTERFSHQGPSTQHIPRAGSPMDNPTAVYPAAPPSSFATESEPGKSRSRRFFTDPLSITLVVVIVVAVAAAGLLGGELYARHRANAEVASVVACIVGDQTSVSFAVTPPLLLQVLNSHYTNISVETAGNQIREAKGMTVGLDIKDVQLKSTPDSAGTIGSLVADVSWTSDGIKQTVENAIPLFGGIVSSVKTNPSDGTIRLEGMLGSVTAKPEVVDNELSLQVVSVSGLGLTLPRETVQPALDAFTKQLTTGFPLGIHADSVQVTDSGVKSQFSTQNAKMPPSNQSGGSDPAQPCFGSL
jgi:hypothetical protein